MSRQTSLNPKTIISSYSLHPDLSQPLKNAIAGCGLKFLSELLTVIATYPDEVAGLLQPVVVKFKAQRPEPVRTKSERTRKKELVSQYSAAELEALIAASKKAVE